MRIVKKVKPLCFLKDQIVFGKSSQIILADIETLRENSKITLPYPFLKCLLSRFKIFNRMLRLGFVGAQVWKGELFAILNKRIYRVSTEVGSFQEEFYFNRGKGPLNLTAISGLLGFDDGLYFGEYFSNPKKDPIHIFCRRSSGSYDRVFTFPQDTINHVHNIVPDYINSCVWVLAGDFNESAGIWRTMDNFQTLEPIVIGSQQCRACVAFPTNEGLLYATDSQFERNHIRLLSKQDGVWISKAVCEINGSCIYGCEVNGEYVFSTSTEPGVSKYKNRLLMLLERHRGAGIIEDESHLVVGSLNKGFKVILKNKKDFWPYRLFQFGTICFPNGSNPSRKLFYYSIANTDNDLETVVIDI